MTAMTRAQKSMVIDIAMQAIDRLTEGGGWARRELFEDPRQPFGAHMPNWHLTLLDGLKTSGLIVTDDAAIAADQHPTGNLNRRWRCYRAVDTGEAMEKLRELAKDRLKVTKIVFPGKSAARQELLVDTLEDEPPETQQTLPAAEPTVVTVVFSADEYATVVKAAGEAGADVPFYIQQKALSDGGEVNEVLGKLAKLMMATTQNVIWTRDLVAEIARDLGVRPKVNGQEDSQHGRDAVAPAQPIQSQERQ